MIETHHPPPPGRAGRPTRRAAILVVLIATMPLAGAAEETQQALHYEWTLSGIFGYLARAFLPGHGEGVLNNRLDDQGHLTTELIVTSRGAKNDYWRYGSESDTKADRLLRAWTSYSFRGKQKSKEKKPTERGVVEASSLIYRISKDPPSAEKVIRVWWDGDILPVRIVPLGVGVLATEDGPLDARLFEIRGEPHAGKKLHGRMSLWLSLADNEPLDFTVSRSLAKVHFRRKHLQRRHATASTP